MTMTFMSSPSLYMTSESVTEGHPDKLCDQIADAILDEILAHDPTAHVACEVTTTTGLVVILGEISTRHHVNYTGIARQVIRDVGYTKPEYGFGADSGGGGHRRGRRRPGDHDGLRLHGDAGPDALADQSGPPPLHPPGRVPQAGDPPLPPP